MPRDLGSGRLGSAFAPSISSFAVFVTWPLAANLKRIRPERISGRRATCSEVCGSHGAVRAPSPSPLRRANHMLRKAMGPNVATPELFAEKLFTDSTSWTVIDRGPFEALVPITQVMETMLPSFDAASASKRQLEVREDGRYRTGKLQGDEKGGCESMFWQKISIHTDSPRCGV